MYKKYFAVTHLLKPQWFSFLVVLQKDLWCECRPAVLVCFIKQFGLDLSGESRLLSLFNHWQKKSKFKMARFTAFCCSPFETVEYCAFGKFPKRAKPVIKSNQIMPCSCIGLFTWQGNIQLSLHISLFRIQRSKTLWNTFGWCHSGIQIYNLSHISTYHSLHEYQLRGWLPSIWAHGQVPFLVVLPTII